MGDGNGRDEVERASAQFTNALQYICAAVRVRAAAATEDTTTAGRLNRLADSFSERAAQALTGMNEAAIRG